MLKLTTDGRTGNHLTFAKKTIKNTKHVRRQPSDLFNSPWHIRWQPSDFFKRPKHIRRQPSHHFQKFQAYSLVRRTSIIWNVSWYLLVILLLRSQAQLFVHRTSIIWNISWYLLVVLGLLRNDETLLSPSILRR